MREPNPSPWSLLSFEGNFSHSMKNLSVTLKTPVKSSSENSCTMVVSLMTTCQSNNDSVGFNIHSLDGKNLPKIMTEKPEINWLRSVSYRYELSPGKYSIEPFQFDKKSNNQFFLRVIYETKNCKNSRSSLRTRIMKTMRRINFNFLR